MPALSNNRGDLLWEGPGEDVEIMALRLNHTISGIWKMSLEVRSPARELAFTDMLDQAAKVKVLAGEKLDEEKIYSGIITRFVQARTRFGNLSKASNKRYNYQIELRPAMWRLSRHFVSQVFQEVSAKDIIAGILDEHGVLHDWRLDQQPPSRLYTIQYGETDFDFICRLAEAEGICFFFDMEKDQAIFTDKGGGHPPCTPADTIDYSEDWSVHHHAGIHERVWDFGYQQEIGPGRFAVNNYNYETSQVGLLAQKEAGELPNLTKMETYEHEHHYPDSGRGDVLALNHQQETTAASMVGIGMSSCRSFTVGHTFTLQKHFRDAMNKKWMVTSVSVDAEQGRYRCHFKTVPAEIPFRPPRRTAKPRLYGPLTAVVTGPKGHEVYLDAMGRCKIHMHWDRESPKTDRSSMWVRVAQGYAGKDYGIQWIPRVGHEVLVTFINGDPDRPLVTGRVYNDFNTAPLGPPRKWQNIIKTIKDNHILFDDQDDKELVDIRAQKDMKTLVLHDQSTDVGHDQSIHVGHDRSSTVDHDSHETVAKNKTVLVKEEDYTQTVAEGNKTVTIKSNFTTTVTDGSVSLTINKGNHQIAVDKGDETHKVATGGRMTVINKDEVLEVKAGNLRQTVEKGGAELSVKAGRSVDVSDGNYDVSASKNLKLTCQKKLTAIGNEEVAISGQEIRITATRSITLGVGSSSITINAQGISLSAAKINSGAVGIHEITGALVKIN